MKTKFGPPSYINICKKRGKEYMYVKRTGSRKRKSQTCLYGIVLAHNNRIE